jgi:peroxiredoxin
MRGLLVGRGSGGVAIGFDQHEARRIVALLENIETRDAGFLETGACVRDGGGFEGFDLVRLHADMDMDDEHGERSWRAAQPAAVADAMLRQERFRLRGFRAVPIRDEFLTPHLPKYPMKTRSLVLALLCLFGYTAASAQPPKSRGKEGGKKAPAEQGPADVALSEFGRAISEPGPKNQARFQKVIAAGVGYLMQFPTHNRVNDVVRDLAFYGVGIDKKEAALRTSYLSFLRLEVTNLRYREGVSEPVLAVLAALDAAMADYELREAFSRDSITTLREKIDALAQTPGAGRFLADRERSYIHVLTLGPGAARAEEHAAKLLTHPERAVATMAREELNILEVKKEPLALKFTGIDGKEVDLEQLRGKVVVLYFWSTANRQSREFFEPLKQVYNAHRKRGLEVVTFSYDKEEDRPKVEQFIKDNKIAWPVHFDGKGAKNEFGPKLNATAVPRFYVLDQKGVLQHGVHGGQMVRITADTPANGLEPQIKKLLGVK